VDDHIEEGSGGDTGDPGQDEQGDHRSHPRTRGVRAVWPVAVDIVSRPISEKA
jgi:hypothetical protein